MSDRYDVSITTACTGVASRCMHCNERLPNPGDGLRTCPDLTDGAGGDE